MIALVALEHGSACYQALSGGMEERLWDLLPPKDPRSETGDEAVFSACSRLLLVALHTQFSGIGFFLAMTSCMWKRPVRRLMAWGFLLFQEVRTPLSGLLQ